MISAFNIGYEGMKVPCLWKEEKSNADTKELENRDKPINEKGSPSNEHDKNGKSKATIVKTITFTE